LFNSVITFYSTSWLSFFVILSSIGALLQATWQMNNLRAFSHCSDNNRPIFSQPSTNRNQGGRRSKLRLHKELRTKQSFHRRLSQYANGAGCAASFCMRDRYHNSIRLVLHINQLDALLDSHNDHLCNRRNGLGCFDGHVGGYHHRQRIPPGTLVQQWIGWGWWHCWRWIGTWIPH